MSLGRLELPTYSLEGSCSIQLSYRLILSLEGDSNSRPIVYKTIALPLSYPGYKVFFHFKSAGRGTRTLTVLSPQDFKSCLSANSNIPATQVTPRGFEPLILWLKTRCPRPLDDGANKTTK